MVAKTAQKSPEKRALTERVHVRSETNHKKTDILSLIVV